MWLDRDENANFSMLTGITLLYIFTVLLILKHYIMKAQELKNEFWLMVKALEQFNYTVIEKEDIDKIDEDELYDLPHAFVLDKHFYYINCFVQRIENGNAYLIGLGEDFGEDYICKIEELSFFTIIELYEQAIEK